MLLKGEETMARDSLLPEDEPVRQVDASDAGWGFQPFRIKDLEMVAQIFPRWNRVAAWLREAERFSTAA